MYPALSGLMNNEGIEFTRACGLGLEYFALAALEKWVYLL
jgi:hypothetical protein